MKELHQLILAPFGLKESALPEPDALSNMKLRQEDEEVLVYDLPAAFPDLWELRLLGRRLFRYKKQNRLSLTGAQSDGLKRVMAGINEIFWGCLETLQKKSGTMSICKSEDGKVLLVLDQSEGEEEQRLPKISVHQLDVGKMLQEVFGKGGGE